MKHRSASLERVVNCLEFQQINKGWFMMGNRGAHIIVKNIFKNGDTPSKSEFTQIWIEIINQAEKAKMLNIKKDSSQA